MREITSSDSCPKRQEQIIVQKGSKDVLLLNMDDGNYYALNEVGNRIWELCDGTRGVAELVGMLAKEYDAPAELIETDVMEVLEDLRGKNLIVERSARRVSSETCDASGRSA